MKEHLGLTKLFPPTCQVAWTSSKPRCRDSPKCWLSSIASSSSRKEENSFHISVPLNVLGLIWPKAALGLSVPKALTILVPTVTHWPSTLEVCMTHGVPPSGSYSRSGDSIAGPESQQERWPTCHLPENKASFFHSQPPWIIFHLCFIPLKWIQICPSLPYF